MESPWAVNAQKCWAHKRPNLGTFALWVTQRFTRLGQGMRGSRRKPPLAGSTRRVPWHALEESCSLGAPQITQNNAPNPSNKRQRQEDMEGVIMASSFEQDKQEEALSGAESDMEEGMYDESTMEDLLRVADEANETALGTDKDSAQQGGSVGKLHKYAIAMGTKPGALSQDSIMEVLLKAAQGEQCWLEYLEKSTSEIKGAAMIITTDAGYNNLMSIKGAMDDRGLRSEL